MVDILSILTRFRKIPVGSPLTTKMSNLTWMISYRPIRCSGRSVKASHLCTLTLAGSHSFGGAWEVSMSKPSSWHVAGRSAERSVSQDLRRERGSLVG
jgi:hypothetical protein